MLIDYRQNRYLKFSVVGGIAEIKFFIGTTIESVIKQYHRYINGYSLHPFWA